MGTGHDFDKSNFLLGREIVRGASILITKQTANKRLTPPQRRLVTALVVLLLSLYFLSLSLLSQIFIVCLVQVYELNPVAFGPFRASNWELGIGIVSRFPVLRLRLDFGDLGFCLFSGDLWE